jgi:hypothetical protein
MGLGNCDEFHSIIDKLPGYEAIDRIRFTPFAPKEQGGTVSRKNRGVSLTVPGFNNAPSCKPAVLAITFTRVRIECRETRGEKARTLDGSARQSPSFLSQASEISASPSVSSTPSGDEGSWIVPTPRLRPVRSPGCIEKGPTLTPFAIPEGDRVVTRVADDASGAGASLWLLVSWVLKAEQRVSVARAFMCPKRHRLFIVSH